MTRQKKEIVLKIAKLDRAIAADENLFKTLGPEIDRLQEELARLSRFETYIDYVMDDRWLCGGRESA